MRRLALTVTAIALSLTVVQAQPKIRIALVGGMLLDGYEAPPIHNSVVLIEGNKIVAKGAEGEVQIPSDAQVIDTSGKTVLPGLIDLHVHLMILGHGDYSRWFPWVVKNGVERVMAISAKQLLHAGVTSAVDLAAPLKESVSIRTRINKGEIPGPRMWMSGPWITMRLGNYPPELKFQHKVDTPEQAAQAVDQLAKEGADVIKAYPGTFEVYKAIADAAHRHNLRVHAHVYNEQNVRDAHRAGIDVLTHVGAASRPPYPEDLMREIVDSGTPVVPTAGLWYAIYPATINFPGRLRDPKLKADFPPDIYEEVQDSFKNYRALGYFQNMPRVMDLGPKLLKQWIDSGAVIGMGTDSGTPMNFHTEALWRELKLFVDHGMSPMRAITNATRINARILGRARDLGTIEPGKLADIIVVKGDPLFDIIALADPEIVIKDGVIYKGPQQNAGRTSSQAQKQQ
jgi:imidazolonepropionase-like amidohydrolase